MQQTLIPNEILVLDIETTGFNYSKDCIVELGILKLNLDTGERTKVFDEVLKEPKLNSKHQKAWIFENKYMTVDEVRLGSPIIKHREFLIELFKEFENRIVAWNIQFDYSWLTCPYYSFKLGKMTKCPMKDSTDYFKIPGKYGNKWPKAQEAWDILFPDKPRTEIHRGYDDADMEAIIIKELYDRGIYDPFK